MKGLVLQSNYQKIIKDQLKIEQDWFSHNINSLDFFFKKVDYYKKEINMLEIGSYEGNSSVFFLKYFSKLKLTCVDTFEGSLEQGDKDFNMIYNNFKLNVSEYKNRLKVIKNSSVEVVVMLGAGDIGIAINEVTNELLNHQVNEV